MTSPTPNSRITVEAGNEAAGREKGTGSKTDEGRGKREEGRVAVSKGRRRRGAGCFNPSSNSPPAEHGRVKLLIYSVVTVHIPNSLQRQSHSITILPSESLTSKPLRGPISFLGGREREYLISVPPNRPNVYVQYMCGVRSTGRAYLFFATDYSLLAPASFMSEERKPGHVDTLSSTPYGSS